MVDTSARTAGCDRILRAARVRNRECDSGKTKAWSLGKRCLLHREIIPRPPVPVPDVQLPILMKTLIRIVVALFVLFLVAVGVSFLLPGSYRVERSVEINASAAAVFARVGDLRNWAEWTPWKERDPGMVTTLSDPSVGKGSWQEWDGPESGKGKLTVSAFEPPSRLAYDLHFPDFDMRSVGEIVLTPSSSGSGVRVTWSDAGRLGKNPLMRWFGLFFDRIIGTDFEKGLANLKRLSETPATGGS